jgi:hypothetical protein
MFKKQGNDIQAIIVMVYSRYSTLITVFFLSGGLLKDEIKIA